MELTPPVNSQILEAVQHSTNFVFGLENNFQSSPSGASLSSGAAIGYEKVAQAAAYAIQDAIDYQRNMLAITGAVQGKALAMIIAGTNVQDATAAFTAANTLVPLVLGTVATIGTNVKAIMQDYPRN
jgi:hypothetical protein